MNQRHTGPFPSPLSSTFPIWFCTIPYILAKPDSIMAPPCDPPPDGSQTRKHTAAIQSTAQTSAANIPSAKDVPSHRAAPQPQEVLEHSDEEMSLLQDVFTGI